MVLRAKLHVASLADGGLQNEEDNRSWNGLAALTPSTCHVSLRMWTRFLGASSARRSPSPGRKARGRNKRQASQSQWGSPSLRTDYTRMGSLVSNSIKFAQSAT